MRVNKGLSGIRTALIAFALTLSAAHAGDFLKHVEDQGSGIKIGHSGPLFVEFFDPDCPYCHTQFEKLMPLVRAGKIRLEEIPVAVLNQNSRPRAAALLESPNPAKALMQGEAGFSGDHLAIRPADHIPAVVGRKIQENNQLLADIDPYREVPAMVFLDHSAGKVASMIGEQPMSVIRRAVAAAQ